MAVFTMVGYQFTSAFKDCLLALGQAEKGEDGRYAALTTDHAIWAQKRLTPFWQAAVQLPRLG
ncbi:hypothetical protein [Salipiger aestuarii]|uniref:hypothetical protein n=1 Tax=Salipiger aestuarii TaxID=568098 RepID=UPI001681A776|nr:hypothetical protein [Salipiger aestuarii]